MGYVRRDWFSFGSRTEFSSPWKQAYIFVRGGLSLTFVLIPVEEGTCLCTRGIESNLRSHHRGRRHMSLCEGR